MVRVHVFVVLLLLFLPFATHLSANSFPKTLRDASGRSVQIPDTPTRIFSGGLNVDSTLLKLLSPERLVAVTRFATRPAYSFVADSAARIPAYKQVRPEEIIKRDPDLVVLTVFSRADIRSKIISLDVPVLITGQVKSRSDIRRNTMLIARAVGRAEAGRDWLETMNHRLENIPSSSPAPSVLYYTYSGSVPGKQTLPDLIMESAGIRNVAAEQGIEGWNVMSPEHILKSQPEWLVFEGQNRRKLIKKLRDDPALSRLSAIKRDRFRSVLPRYSTVASPFIYRAAEHWATLFQRETNNGG